MSRYWAIFLLGVLAALGVYAHVALDRWRALEPVDLAAAGVRPFDLPFGHGADAVGLPLPAAVEEWFWAREALPRLDAALHLSPELRIRIANVIDEVEAGGGPLHAPRLADLRERVARAEAEGVAKIERIAGARPAGAPAGDPPPLPDAVVDALSGAVVDAGTPMPGEPPRSAAACPARVGAAALTRVEFFAGVPADDTQVFPIDVESRGEVAALFVFRGDTTMVRCTYGEGADAAVIESPVAPPSCLVEGLDGTPRVTCPSPVSPP